MKKRIIVSCVLFAMAGVLEFVAGKIFGLEDILKLIGLPKKA